MYSSTYKPTYLQIYPSIYLSIDLSIYLSTASEVSRLATNEIYVHKYANRERERERTGTYICTIHRWHAKTHGPRISTCIYAGLSICTDVYMQNVYIHEHAYNYNIYIHIFCVSTATCMYIYIHTTYINTCIVISVHVFVYTSLHYL